MVEGLKLSIIKMPFIHRSVNISSVSEVGTTMLKYLKHLKAIKKQLTRT